MPGRGFFQKRRVIFWAALLVRLLYITLAHTYRFRIDDHHFHFGYEMGRVASALATGYGYADPFNGHTGPTTWVPPLYPLLLAGVFKVFGVYSVCSAWVILALNSVFCSLTTLVIWEIAALCFNRRVALWSAWIWALYPAAMQYAVRWVWDMTLSALLLSLILLLAIRMRGIGEPSVAEPAKSRTLARWLWFGLLWGLLALSNPSVLLFLPACGLWILRGTARPRQQAGFAAASAAVFLLCLSPWVVRNALTFHRFIPIRANLGAELYLGNGPGATGFLMEYNHPHGAPDQMRLYRQMGEVEYARMRGHAALRTIERDPGLFLRNSVKRMYFYWISVPHPSATWWVEAGRVANYAFASIAGFLGLLLALRRRVPGAWLFAWAFLLVPPVYYFVTAAARFRHPLEPVIAILAVYLFQSAEKRMPRAKIPASTVDGSIHSPVS